MREVWDKLPKEAQDAILKEADKALSWRDHDRDCKCHACDSIRRIAAILLKAGYDFAVYN